MLAARRAQENTTDKCNYRPAYPEPMTQICHDCFLLTRLASCLVHLPHDPSGRHIPCTFYLTSGTLLRKLARMYGFLGSYPSECNDCAEEANWRVPQVPEDPADTPQRRRREGACTGYPEGMEVVGESVPSVYFSVVLQWNAYPGSYYVYSNTQNKIRVSKQEHGKHSRSNEDFG